MSIETHLVDYFDQDTALQGFFAYDSSKRTPLPTVLIAHQWDGRSVFVEQRALQLAQEGYGAFAVDMYGKGVLGRSTEENMTLMRPFMEDRGRIVQRLNAAIAAVGKLQAVNATQLAAIGYCFGGLCALDLARSGSSAVRGVASFHGLLKPSGLPQKKITAKVLVLHGAEDPMSSSDDVIAFQNEMTVAEADWQLHIYGHAKHAFAVPGAHNPDLGLEYHAMSEKRSWRCAMNFLQEILA